MLFFNKKSKKRKCEFCGPASKIKLTPCANGEMNIVMGIIDKGIVVFQHGLALGFLDVEYCPKCGAKLERRIVC
ncbi:MAG: hypothetical protein FWB73_05930 [Treponema sp.]|nr:hypothetical protein [Treponema sp.]